MLALKIRTHRASRFGAVLALVLPLLMELPWTTLTGCATPQVYRLPLDASLAPSMNSYLIKAAEALGYEARQLSDAVNILQKDGWIAFTVQGNEFGMNLVLTDKTLSPEQREARLGELKTLGDMVWSRAYDRYQSQAPPG